jgi:predicted DNA-binding protein (MmcQ/YjbR family)
MTLDSIRDYCRSLPHVTEDVKWGNDLCFLIGGKMFAVTSLEQSNPRLSFKCPPEIAAELVEVDGIIPAPYMARHHWVSMEKLDALRDSDIRKHLAHSYELVKAGLPKKLQELMAAAPTSRAKASKRGRAKAK